MKYTLDKSNVERVEEDIQPPMLQAITLPIMCHGIPTGLCVYVAQSPFLPLSADSRMLPQIAAMLKLDLG